MKKKLVSVLLALALCGSLAIPAFAEPTEETHTPEDTTPLEEVTTEETEVPETMSWSVIRAEEAKEASDHDHRFENGELVRTWYEEEGNQHQKWAEYKAYCIYGCGAYSTLCEPIGDLEPHSWGKGSTVYRSNGASTHTVTYNYSCKCGATKTESVTESHSLQKTFTGNHYHVEGSAKHMAEYRYTCSGCGYSTTKWEYYICPGGSGGGCLYPTSLDEEELMGDVTVPEDVVLPEDVTTSEEAMEPDETDTPGEITTPEETAGPEEPYE